MRSPLIPAGKAGGDAYAYGDASGAGGMTELQKHAAFFDANNDGIVSFSETYDGDPFPPYSVTTFSSFLFDKDSVPSSVQEISTVDIPSVSRLQMFSFHGSVSVLRIRDRRLHLERHLHQRRPLPHDQTGKFPKQKNLVSSSHFYRSSVLEVKVPC
jgi:hypothetical protein